MPSPNESLATLRPDLGGSVTEFDLAMDRAGFISHRILPVFEASKQSASFGRIKLKELLQNRETTRNSSGGYSRGKWEFEDDSYATREHGFEEPVDDRDSEIYGEYFDAEMVAAEIAQDTVLRNREKRVAGKIFDPTVWTGSSLTHNVTHEWDDAANAVPVTDVNTAVQKVWDNCGLWPNAIIFNRSVFRNLRNCASVKAEIASSGAGSSQVQGKITVQQIAELFDLPMVLVAGSAKNIADKGLDASISHIWSSEYAMVARIAMTNNLKEPCLGRTLHWGGDGSQIGTAMESYRDETVRANIIRARHEVDEKILYVEAAVLLDNVTTI